MGFRGRVNKECRGCTIKVTRSFCLFIAQEIADKCPCIECLVKVTCNKKCGVRNKTYGDLTSWSSFRDWKK